MSAGTSKSGLASPHTHLREGRKDERGEAKAKGIDGDAQQGKLMVVVAEVPLHAPDPRHVAERQGAATLGSVVNLGAVAASLTLRPWRRPLR